MVFSFHSGTMNWQHFSLCAKLTPCMLLFQIIYGVASQRKATAREEALKAEM